MISSTLIKILGTLNPTAEEMTVTNDEQSSGRIAVPLSRVIHGQIDGLMDVQVTGALLKTKFATKLAVNQPFGLRPDWNTKIDDSTLTTFSLHTCRKLSENTSARIRPSLASYTTRVTSQFLYYKRL